MAALKIFFDGGCRPNPGAMEVAAVARGVAHVEAGLGFGDNHDAEWLALLHALRIAQAIGANDIVLIGDSRAVIDQAKGRSASVRADRHRAAFDALVDRFARVRFRHVMRSKNLAGTALEKRHGRL